MQRGPDQHGRGLCAVASPVPHAPPGCASGAAGQHNHGGTGVKANAPAGWSGAFARPVYPALCSPVACGTSGCGTGVLRLREGSRAASQAARGVSAGSSTRMPLFKVSAGHLNSVGIYSREPERTTAPSQPWRRGGRRLRRVSTPALAADRTTPVGCRVLPWPGCHISRKARHHSSAARQCPCSTSVQPTRSR